MRQFVDRALSRSRATLVRDLRRILQRFASSRGEDGAIEGAMSRATLGAETAEFVADVGANVVVLSRMSLGDRGLP